MNNTIIVGTEDNAEELERLLQVGMETLEKACKLFKKMNNKKFIKKCNSNTLKKMRDRRRIWREENAEKLKDYHRKYYLKHKKK